MDEFNSFSQLAQRSLTINVLLQLCGRIIVVYIVYTFLIYAFPTLSLPLWSTLRIVCLIGYAWGAVDGLTSGLYHALTRLGFRHWKTQAPQLMLVMCLVTAIEYADQLTRKDRIDSLSFNENEQTVSVCMSQTSSKQCLEVQLPEQFTGFRITQFRGQSIQKTSASEEVPRSFLVTSTSWNSIVVTAWQLSVAYLLTWLLTFGLVPRLLFCCSVVHCILVELMLLTLS